MNGAKSGCVVLAIEPQSSSLLRTDQFTASGRQKKVSAVPGLTDLFSLPFQQLRSVLPLCHPSKTIYKLS